MSTSIQPTAESWWMDPAVLEDARLEVRRRKRLFLPIAASVILLSWGPLLLLALLALNARNISGLAALGKFSLPLALVTVAGTRLANNLYHCLGAWDINAFANVDGRRFLRTVKRHGPEAVRVVLQAVQAPGYLGLARCRRALAAVEVVAAGRGYPMSAVPSVVWDCTMKYQSSWLAADVNGRSDLQQMARYALQRVLWESRLRDRFLARRGRTTGPAEVYYSDLEKRVAEAGTYPRWTTAVSFPGRPTSRPRRSRWVWVVIGLTVGPPLLALVTGIAFGIALSLGVAHLDLLAAVVTVFVAGSFIVSPLVCGYYCAWMIWSARWLKGRDWWTRRRATLSPMTRRSWPVAVATWIPAIPWLFAGIALRPLEIVALVHTGVGLVLIVLIEALHRPVWLLPADLRSRTGAKVRRQ